MFFTSCFAVYFCASELMVDRPDPPRRNRQGSSYSHQGLVVVKRGKGACIWSPSLGMCLLPKSDHAVGHWLSFDVFNRNVAPKHNSDIGTLVDMSRHQAIPAPVPTFVTCVGRMPETPVLYISSVEELEYFLAEMGPRYLPAVQHFPVFVFRVLQSTGGQLSYWEVVQNLNGISAVQSREHSVSPKEFIERLEQQRKLRQREVEYQRPQSPVPIPQIPPNPCAEAAEAVLRLLSQRGFQEECRKYDVVAYRKLYRLANEVYSSRGS